MGIMVRLMSFALPLLVLSIAIDGCTSVAQVTDLTEPPCSTAFEQQLASILMEQGEKAEAATTLASRTRTVLALGNLGPRPFLVPSPSGTDYSLFIELKHSDCLLRLYGRQKGFVSYTNNLTYIATRPLPACTCSE